MSYGLRARVGMKKKTLLAKTSQHARKEWAINYFLELVNFWKNVVSQRNNSKSPQIKE